MERTRCEAHTKRIAQDAVASISLELQSEVDFVKTLIQRQLEMTNGLVAAMEKYEAGVSSSRHEMAALQARMGAMGQELVTLRAQLRLGYPIGYRHSLPTRYPGRPV